MNCPCETFHCLPCALRETLYECTAELTVPNDSGDYYLDTNQVTMHPYYTQLGDHDTAFMAAMRGGWASD